MADGLPKHFCWTRFGTEAGETIDAILQRKERERVRNGGVFLWGVGNAVGPSMQELLRREAEPEVVFSPIRSAPKAVDASPSGILTWSSGRGLDGTSVVLPRWSVVTSRAPANDRAPRHYALVCYSPKSLRIDADAPTFAMGCLENLLTQRQVGASQVTAIVRRGELAKSGGPSYQAAMRVRLVAPFFVELTTPTIASKVAQRQLALDAGGPSSH